jgi:hypothetical protein
VFTERTSIGLDVHARSVAAAAIDGVTGEVFQIRLTPSYEHIRSWVSELPGPVAVAYEAGPTGFGLHRALTEAAIRCEVVAPSKLQRHPETESRPMPGMHCSGLTEHGETLSSRAAQASTTRNGTCRDL